MSAPRSPSGETAEAGRGPTPALIAVVAVALAVHLVAAALLPLTEDEAYYRLWSMRPAFGYYDHPPMVAWWIWLGRRLLGDTALGVRLLACIASAFTSLLVFDLARLAGAEAPVASRAGIWFNAMPLVVAGGCLAVPDASASLFWAAALVCVLRAARGGGAAWWMAAGAAAGLATLSKYSALFLGPGVFLWLASTRQGRQRLATSGPWIAAVVAAALFAVNVIWNADHQWLTFHKQFGRLAATRFEPRYLAELVGGQLVLVNPLLATLAGAAVWVRPGAGDRGPRLAPLLAMSAPFACYLVIHSLHDRVQAHWPAPLYPVVAVCAAVAAERLRRQGAWRHVAQAAPAVGWSLCALAVAYAVAPVALTGRADLALPVRGWTPFATRLEALRARARAAWVGTTSYGLAAQLADQPPLSGPVVQLTERDRWRGLAMGAPADPRRPGLVVDLDRRVSAAVLGRCFTRVAPLGMLARGDPGEPGKLYSVFVVSGPRRDVLSSGC